jgi:hypothetical protein
VRIVLRWPDRDFITGAWHEEEADEDFITGAWDEEEAVEV